MQKFLNLTRKEDLSERILEIKLDTFRFFLLKSDISGDTNALNRPVVKLSNRESPEVEFVAEESPMKDCLPVGPFKLTTAGICLLSLKCCVN
jgi:hypothetical protein